MVMRRGAGSVIVLALSFVAAVASPVSSPQDNDRTCLVCHDDPGLRSSAGTPVYVDPKLLAGSVHGRAAVGCIGCHTDLSAVEDFPHASGLETVRCKACHGDYARTSSGGVHGTSARGLTARPVLCKDCHGAHDILPSSDPRSPVHPSNRPSTCGRCHPGAGPNFSRGRVHEFPATGGPSPAGVVRALYKVLIGGMTGFFLLYIAVDLLRWGRGR
jgi:hypothetical protein